MTLKTTLILLALCPAVPLFAGPQATIEYLLTFAAARNHYVDVEMEFASAGEPHIDLTMAVWTPGSYLVREYARHVEGLSARAPGGERLEVTKTTKNRWRVDTQGAARLRVSYRVYCREMSVRTNWVDEEFALLNGAPTFMTVAGRPDTPHRVRLVLPFSWTSSACALPLTEPGSEHDYLARDFDELVDSPILVGDLATYRFEVAGADHALVQMGEGEIWDGATSARDVETVVREHHRFWGPLPYERYLFLNLIVEAGGGLEHDNSTVLMTSRWSYGVRKDYLAWLGLVSHEFFHTWNVRRLRPRALVEYDYETENYTPSLWIAEGITSYYGDLALPRARLCTEKEYLELLSKSIGRLQSVPGRNVQSLHRASHDAWIKFYRPDENTSNTTVSYYTKGEVVAFLLDARIRRVTGGARSLDEVMRLLYERHSGARGYEPEDFRAVVREVAGEDFSPWLKAMVESTEELDYAPALEWYGLRFEPADAESEESAEDEDEDEDAEPEALPSRLANALEAKPEKVWLGAATEERGGRLLVQGVRRGSPAAAAGLNAGDEILALGDYRVTAADWAKRLDQYRPGDQATVLLARRERLMRVPIEFGAEPRPWKLEIAPGATQEQHARRRAWLRAGEAF